MSNLEKIAKKAGIELSYEIEFFGELIAEECADIAESAYEVGLPAGPIIRRHYNLIESKAQKD